MFKTMTFLRHPEALGNTMSQDDRAALEIPNHSYGITDNGYLQLNYVVDYLTDRWSNFPPDIILCSTFNRTIVPAHIIREILDPDSLIQIIQDSRLDEKWDGVFHELSWEELRLKYPDQIRFKDRNGYYHNRPLSGESCPDVELRIHSILSDPRLEDKNIFVVGHGRWHSIFQKLWYNLCVQEFLRLKEKKVDNCTLFEYSRGSKTFVEGVIPWKGRLEVAPSELA